MKHLKIGIVFDDTLDTADGIQQYIQTIAKWLSSHGHEVHFLVGETNRRDIVNVHSLSKNIKVKFNQNRLSMPLPANKAAIKQLLDIEQFDVLHVQMPYSPWLAARVVAQAKGETAIVGTFHIMPAGNTQAFATRLLGHIERKTLQRFDSVVSVSAPAQDFAAKSLGLASDILPNCVDAARFSAGKKTKKYDDGKHNIVTMSRLVERKGIDHLIRAFALLKRDDCRLTIYGKGPLLKKLTMLSRKLGVQDSVLFAGFVDEKDKANVLAAADIAVYPSTGAESFGIVLIEAVAAGAGVVLAGDNPGYRSVMNNDARVLFDPSNTSEFAHLINTYLNDSKAIEAVGAWQRAHCKQFDVAVVGPKLVDLYNQALQRKQKVR